MGPLGAAIYRANLAAHFRPERARQEVPPCRLCLQGGNFLEAEARRGSTLCAGELFIAELERDCPNRQQMLCTGWRLDTSFVLDGEAVLFGVDGPSDFGGLHARRMVPRSSSRPSTSRSATARSVRKLPLQHAQGEAGGTSPAMSPAVFQDFAQGRSALTCFATPARWDWKGWSPSIARLIAAAGSGTG